MKKWNRKLGTSKREQGILTDPKQKKQVEGRILRRAEPYTMPLEALLFFTTMANKSLEAKK